MRKAAPLLIIAAAVALSGCARGGTLDEFAVARNAPLVIPPDYALVPPAAGTLSTSAESAQAQAIDALFGGPAPRSAAETSLLDEAGRDRSALGIRSLAGDPNTRVVDKGALTMTILNAGASQSAVASAK